MNTAERCPQCGTVQNLDAAIAERVAALTDAQVTELGRVLSATAYRMGRSAEDFANEQRTLEAEKRAELLRVLRKEPHE